MFLNKNKSNNEILFLRHICAKSNHMTQPVTLKDIIKICHVLIFQMEVFFHLDATFKNCSEKVEKNSLLKIFYILKRIVTRGNLLYIVKVVRKYSINNLG